MFRQLNNLFILILIGVSANIFAGTSWDVAAVFLSKDEDSQFQADIQKNISEIQRIKKNSDLTISAFVEAKNSTNEEIVNFIKKSLKRPNAKKMLIIYSHGLGADGLKNLNTLTLKNEILNKIPHLDIMWFDACFMANLEFLFELRKTSEYSIASEDAEFTSGLAYESLAELPNYNSSEEASKFLARDFIASYSYLKNGIQKQNVNSSSATITVIENKKLENIILKIKTLKKTFEALSENDKNQILNRIQQNFQMDNNDLVDLGHLAIETRIKNKDKLLDKELTELVRDLNVKSNKALKTNPRIKINTPSNAANDEKAILVWGFNNWTRGNDQDFKENGEVLNNILKPDGFIKGPKNQLWPYKKIVNSTNYLSPFAPGINTFNYLFISADGTKLLMNNKSFERNLDIVEFSRGNDSINNLSPVVLSSYTQEIGKSAEKYTGLNITRPNAVTNLDYLDLEFNNLVQWIKM